MSPLRIGLVGSAFMGGMHAHAWRTAPRFFDLPMTAELTVLAGRDQARAAASAERLGFASATDDWRTLLERDDVDLIDICTPGDLHAEIAIAALNAGKHVLCEKPLANTATEAEQMAQAAASAAERGVFAMCGFTYRRTPALSYARELIEQGRVGRVRHVRALYLQDWLSDETAPMTWRLDAERAGSGSLGDLGAHLIDLAQWLTGQQISAVSGVLETFVTSRPMVGEMSGLGGKATIGADVPMGEVTVDDAAIFMARLHDGVVATFEATRFATGHKNALRIEINGTAGSVAFDFENNHVLRFVDASDPDLERGFREIHTTEPGHPYIDAWWPPGHGVGYEAGFIHQVADLTRDIAAARQPRPSFTDAWQVQRVLTAVADSHQRGGEWTPVPD